MMADPRGLYSVEDPYNSDPGIHLDTAVGYGCSSQSMRYDLPDRTGDPGTVAA